MAIRTGGSIAFEQNVEFDVINTVIASSAAVNGGCLSSISSTTLRLTGVTMTDCNGGLRLLLLWAGCGMWVAVVAS